MKKLDPFDHLDQIGNPARPTRRCTICGLHEGPRRELRATQFLAPPPNQLLWLHAIEFACAGCRHDKGRFRVPSYHPKNDAAPWIVKANQLAGADCRAITLTEPWAWLIQQGFKDCENRTWHSNFTGRALIHAGKKIAPDFDRIAQFVGPNLGILLPSREWLLAHHAGRLVAVVEFAVMESHIDSPWKMKGQWAWPIRWSHAINPTEPVRGALGLWRVNPEQVVNVAPNLNALVESNL